MLIVLLVAINFLHEFMLMRLLFQLSYKTQFLSFTGVFYDESLSFIFVSIILYYFVTLVLQVYWFSKTQNNNNPLNSLGVSYSESLVCIFQIFLSQFFYHIYQYFYLHDLMAFPINIWSIICKFIIQAMKMFIGIGF